MLGRPELADLGAAAIATFDRGFDRVEGIERVELA